MSTEPVRVGPRPPWLLQYVALALALPGLLVAFGIWLDGEYSRMKITADLVEHTSNRRDLANDILASLRKAETAQRGYVITIDPRFLEAYRPSCARIVQDLAGLDEIGRKLAITDRRMRALRGLIAAKFSEMDEVLRILRQSGRNAATRRVADGRGKLLMDQIEAQLAAITAADAAQTAAGRASFWERTYRSRQLVWLIIALLGGLVMIGTLLIWMARRERWRVMMAQSDALTRNQAILDSTSDAIIILNPSGTIENVNAAARSVLGYEPAELSRRDISVVLDIADGDGSFHERIGLVAGALRQTLFVDRSARTKDGRVIPVDVALGLMPVPDGLHVVASVRDISHRREIERIKDDFIATVSHELRTPLTSVVGSLGLLRGGAAGLLPDAAGQLVEIAENNARRLIRLTNDILDLEKFGSGQMALEMAPADLLAIMRQAIAESEVPARAKGVTIALHTAERDCSIHADRQRLLQVATNLLSNAVRHTAERSTVTVSVEVERGRAVARICDQGPGVPAEYRDHIFDRFVQAPMPGMSGGTGLGLAIAREIIHRHGGAIWLETAEGGGACFAFALACAEDSRLVEPEMAAPEPDMAPASLSQRLGPDCPTILQIDDDVDLVTVVAASLAGEARVIRADNLASARAILELEKPDLVVLDIGLPDGSGLDILPLLVDADGKQLPTIVFSAQDSPLELSGKVEAVLTKSRSTLPTLRATIRRVLAERSRS